MSEQKKQRPVTKMVPVQSKAIVPERDADKSPILECHHLGIDFGGLTAVNDFNLMVGRTEIAGLIGPNGAGKTTIFNLLTKVYQPTRGSILLDGADTSKMTTEQVNRAGIARTFQNIRLFNNLSVEDNVKLGLHNHIGYGMWGGVLRLPKYWKEEAHAHDSAMELLRSSTWSTLRTRRRARYPTARSAAWRSSAHWRPTRACCSSTSRRRA